MGHFTPPKSDHRLGGYERLCELAEILADVTYGTRERPTWRDKRCGSVVGGVLDVFAFVTGAAKRVLERLMGDGERETRRREVAAYPDLPGRPDAAESAVLAEPLGIHLSNIFMTKEISRYRKRRQRIVQLRTCVAVQLLGERLDILVFHGRRVPDNERVRRETDTRPSIRTEGLRNAKIANEARSSVVLWLRESGRPRAARQYGGSSPT